MATALVSLISGRLARPDTGMTGEITLRGQVLPVGGVKEKVLAAHRSGLKTVILPARNEADLDDLPEDVRRELQFVFVETVQDVLETALEPAPSQPEESENEPANKDSIAEFSRPAPPELAQEIV